MLQTGAAVARPGSWLQKYDQSKIVGPKSGLLNASQETSC